MRIATFNINGIKARLPRLVEWLTETQPDVACLQEIKTQDEGFPIKDIEAAGYGAIWHGQKGFNGVAILAKGRAPMEVARGLEGEAEDDHSRYLEADVNGVRIATIYLPNGNPQPGPKFDYKIRWMTRLRQPTRHPLGGVWTYWDYQAAAWPRDAGFRIDHLLLSPAAADRLVDAQVDKDHRGRERASDHAPVWVQLRD